MATELLPVVDLRVLSQSDLDALAAASAHALAPRSCPDADPLPPLKIDRAVFNESAGSRKQTFSRLRLGTAASSSPSAPARPSSARRSITGNDPDDSNLVAYQLRRLFVPDDPSLPPHPPESQTLALADPDRVTTNANGVSVDLVRLAGMVDPYDAELQKATAGMSSRAELQGFIDSVAGKWASQRQKKKYVDASFFGDHLPRGWKLKLGVKQKEGAVWVHCLSYVSPKGSEFSTCKEVSAYLMSLLGYPEIQSVTDQYESTGQLYLCANSGDDNDQIYSGVDKINTVSDASLACQKCNLTFCDLAAYEQHRFSCHEMSAKRRRTGKFGDPIIGKDGKFECPICQKTFEEESRYFGHLGSHARYQGLTPEEFFDKATSGRAINDSLAEVSFTPQELTGLPGQNKVSDGEAGFQHYNHSNEYGDNNSTVTGLFTTNCSYNFIGPNKAFSRPEEFRPIADVPSVCRYASDTGRADITVTKRASNSSHQSVGNNNVFAGVPSFNGQLRSNHIARPTAFGTANHYQDRIIDHGMAAPQHTDNNTVKARDVNLNSSLDTISFPIASANNETASAFNEVNRSAITAKCFSGSFNNNDGASSTSSCSGSTNKISSSFGMANKTSVVATRCFDPSYGSYGHDYGALKANPFANKNNTTVYQASLCTQPVNPVATKADHLASRSVQSKNSGQEVMPTTKEQMGTVKNRTSKEAGCGTEAYSGGTFSGGITERGFTQFNNSFTQTKPNSSSRCSLPESNTLATGNFIKGSGSDANCMKNPLANRGDVNFTKGSFVNRPISNNEPNAPRLEVMGKSINEMQNRYNGCVPSCEPHAASRTSQNVNGLMSTQANFGSMSSVVQSVGDVPVTSTAQDQCDLQLGFGAQKQQIFSSHGSSATGSPQLGSNARNNSLPTGSSQIGSMDRPKSLSTPQFGGFSKPNSVSAAPSQLGSMARPNYAESSQFTSMVQPNSIPPKSSQFGRKGRPDSVSPANTSQFRSVAGPNSVPPAQSSQFGSMAKPNSVPLESSQFFGNVSRPNSATPAESSQFGSSMSRPNSAHPAVSSQFGNMPVQNLVSTSEPTLVLGYAPQMGSVPPPTVQLGWDSSLPRMVSGGMLTCVCIWCNSQFHHFGPIDGQQAGSFGFICPTCKERMSGHHNMPSNGSWQP